MVLQVKQCGNKKNSFGSPSALKLCWAAAVPDILMLSKGSVVLLPLVDTENHDKVVLFFSGEVNNSVLWSSLLEWATDVEETAVEVVSLNIGVSPVIAQLVDPLDIPVLDPVTLKLVDSTSDEVGVVKTKPNLSMVVYTF